MTQCCHHLHESTNQLVASHSRVSVLDLFGLFCVSRFLVCFVCLCLVDDDDGLLDYVQVLHQFSFVTLNSRWPGILICNYCFCNVISVLNDLAEAMKALDGKRSMCRTRQSSIELVLIAAVASFCKTKWLVPLVHCGVSKRVSGIPSKWIQQHSQ